MHVAALLAEGNVARFVHDQPILVVLMSIVLIVVGLGAIVISRDVEFLGCLVVVLGLGLIAVGASLLGDLIFGWQLLM
jgi:hypothetical protein